MKRKWRKLTSRINQIISISLLILMIVGMTGCIGGGGLGGCMSCIPGMGGGTDFVTIIAYALFGYLLWQAVQKFRKK